jgi:hypothetical protein
MRYSLLVVGAWVALCGPQVTASGQCDTAGSRRHWRVMVIVPEVHLARPRIPDPAAETMFCKKLIDAGYKVVDQDRYSALRYNDVVERIVAQGPNWRQDVRKLGARFGADVLITGSAFTQEVSNNRIQTEAGPANSIKCRCRIELKGILVDSAEKFYADSIQKTGPADLTVELASKSCLEAGAEDMAAAQIEQMDKRLLGAKGQGDESSHPQLVELHVRNVSSTSIERLGDALKRVPGVIAVDPGGFDRGDYSAELKIPQRVSALVMASRIAAFPALRPLRLKVISAGGSRLTLVSGR